MTGNVEVFEAPKKRRWGWNERLGPADCPYAYRWFVDFGLFSIRLHHWLKSDDLRHAHDHAWWFVSLVLWGVVWDRSAAYAAEMYQLPECLPPGPCDVDRRRGWLSVTAFAATHRHMVVIDKPAWTLLVTGPVTRIWGYWVEGKFRRREKYFGKFGHHDPCS